MLDIKFIRENPEIIKEAARKKGVDFDIDRLIIIDDRRKEALQSFEEKRALQNEHNVKIKMAPNPEVRAKLIKDMQVLKQDIQKAEEDLKFVMTDWQKTMLEVPNVPDVSVPEGKSEEDNVEEKVWGEKTQFDFKAKDHVELMTDLDMVDFERGVKTHGFRGYFLKNDGALLSWAIWNYAKDFFLKKNFQPFIAPGVVRKEHFYGTGHLPGDEDDLFKTQDDDFLSGTAEVPMMAYHSKEVLKEEELPKRYLAFSPCFRREAGSHGKDIKGLIRVHEFYKWEQLILCLADHAESDKFFEEINRNNEEFIETLNLPYRRMNICGGDLSANKVKSYDVEIWVPQQNTYREISSASYYHDFQSRRFGIKYKDKDGNMKYAHSLNCTAIPTPRILVSLVENYQQEDGSILIPEVLRPYMGGRERISKSQ